MFNRVGNLTVLSLRREINQIVEEQCSTQKTPVSELNDFATVRIYWRYFTPKGEPLPPAWGKAFYLYTGTGLREVASHDLEAIVPHVSARIREKVNLGLHYQG